MLKKVIPVLVICTLICALLIPINGRAQEVKTSKDFKISLGTPYKVIDANTKDYFVFDNTLLTFKKAGKKVFIQKIDLKNMREVSMREVTDLPDGYESEGFFQVTDRVIYFYSLWDKKNQKEQLFSRELDFAKGNFSAGPKLVISVNGKITGSMVNTSRFGYGIQVTDKFTFTTSFDSTKLAVRYRKKPEKRDDSKNYDEIGMYIFNYDKEIVKVWGKELRMPYTEAKMDELDFTVDSKGNAYILAKVYEGEKKREKDKEGHVLYTMELLKVDVNTQEILTKKIALPERFISEVILSESEGNNLTLVGYFSNGNKKDSGVDGVFMSRINSKGEFSDMKSYAIPIDIINMYESKKVVKKNTKKEEDDDDEKGAQLRDLDLRKVIFKADGSILICGEQYKVIVRTTTDSKGQTRTTYRYYYEDILATKINADGSLAWMKRMPKTQIGGSGQGGMSYKLIENGDNYYFLFLDNIKNLNLAPDQEPAKHGDGAGGYLTSYRVNDKTGEVAKLSLFDTRNVNGTEVFQFAVSRIFKATANEFIAEAYKKGKEDVLIKIKLNEMVN